MNKILIIYNSKTGNTKYYAELLAKELKADCIPFYDVNTINLNHYSTVLFGSRIQAGTILGLKKMKKLIQESTVKNFVIFTTGASPMNEADVEKLWNSNLSQDELKSFSYFYLPAGLNYESMGLGDKLMMKTLWFALGLKTNPTEEDIAQREMISHSYDIKDDSFIKPVLDKVHSFINE